MKSSPRNGPAEPTKKCRYCFLEIPASAEVCPECGETVVRVKSQMVKLLGLVLILAFAFMFLSGSLLTRCSFLNRQEVSDEYLDGVSAGREAARRQLAADREHGRDLRETLPEKFRFFLKDQTPGFRLGFEEGFFKTYRRLDPETKDPEEAR